MAAPHKMDRSSAYYAGDGTLRMFCTVDGCRYCTIPAGYVGYSVGEAARLGCPGDRGR